MYLKSATSSSTFTFKLPYPQNLTAFTVGIVYFGFSKAYANNAPESKILIEAYCDQTQDNIPLLTTGVISKEWNEPTITHVIYQTLPSTTFESLTLRILNQHGKALNTHTGYACAIIHLKKY